MKNSLKIATKSLALGVALIGLVANRPKIDQPAPDVQLTLIDGSRIALHDLRGDVVVLNFWATWCQPCKKELPLLDAYYRIQKQHGLRVFAVTTEDSLSLRELRPLFGNMAIQPVKQVHGPYAALGAVPTNFVIDRAGNVRYAKADMFTLDTLNEVIVPLLKEPTPADAPAPPAP